MGNVMTNFEVLPDGRDDWHFSHEFEAIGPAQAAEKFAEYVDWHSTEFAYAKEGGIVQVRKKGGGDVWRYNVVGETRPHYEAQRLVSPNPAPVGRS